MNAINITEETHYWPEHAIDYELKPFDKVLVRDYSEQEWKCGIFSHETNDEVFMYQTTEKAYKFCIPFEEYKNLLGTTNKIPRKEINYSELQSSSDIAVGDVVFIYRKATSHEYGWSGLWHEALNNYVRNKDGITSEVYGHVLAIDPKYGILVMFSEKEQFFFPFQVVRKMRSN